MLDCGTPRLVRNGKTLAIFGHQMRFNMQNGFPFLTTKLLPFTVVYAELRWFLDAGSETGRRLSTVTLNRMLGKKDDAPNIWTQDQENFAKAGKAQFPGDCGRIYGAQWRNWKSSDGRSIDQINLLIKRLREDPFSRYHIVSAWNPGELSDMCLPPCHMKMQFFVRPSRRRDKKMYLDMSMDQRSCDMFLGVPFNIASYALLLHMVAQCVDMIPGELVITLEDAHIYTHGWKDGKLSRSLSHLNAVKQQLERTPLPAPHLWLDPQITEIDDFGADDAQIIEYRNLGKISAPLITG